MTGKTKTIGFRGDEKYRARLAQAALDRGLKVQGLLERAVEAYLAAESPGDNRTELHKITPTTVDSDILSDRERQFIRECLRIYRSDFGKPLQENVKFFGLGLAAIEKIAAIEAGHGERSHPDAPTAGERRTAAKLDLAENEADLLKKAIHDAAEKHRGAVPRDKETADRPPARRTGGKRKTGSGSGD